MQSFKSSQLAAWLNPLHSQSVIRATCRPPITVRPSDHASLLAFSMPNYCCRKIYYSCSLSSWCFIHVMNRSLQFFFITSCSNTKNSSASRHLSFQEFLFQRNFYLRRSCTFETVLLCKCWCWFAGGNIDYSVSFLICRNLSLPAGCSLPLDLHCITWSRICNVVALRPKLHDVIYRGY